MKFGKYPSSGEVWSILEARANGFETGLTWSEPYVPGGPHVKVTSRTGRYPNPDWVAYCRHTFFCHAEWMDGWRSGLALKRSMH